LGVLSVGGSVSVTFAVQAGATRNEILEAATIGVEVGGGPSFVVVRDNLLDFLDDIGTSV